MHQNNIISGSLARDFDAVVMLTWSDWHREPRSNRYHYATRFARELPVIFVQPDNEDGSVVAEQVPGSNITILHVSNIYGPEQTHHLLDALSRMGIRRPLIWIYNVYFEHFVRRVSSKCRVYHATEDYLSPTDTWVVAGSGVQEPLKRILKDTDIVVSVSEGVAQSYRDHGAYTGQVVVLRNGCDFDFWFERKAYEYQPPDGGAKVAFFQGGINRRLDFDLLLELTEALPDWQFWFCGKSEDAPPEWLELKKRMNVRDFGQVDSETISSLARQALVGLIPFKQDGLIRRSLPLKAYEYVACGLPVVTVPIDALATDPELFRTATGSAEFAVEIQNVAETRTDAEATKARLAAAKLQSYDERFDILKGILLSSRVRTTARPHGNLLMLYDDRSTHVRTIQEHLRAFQSYSRHKTFFMPATGFLSGIDDAETWLDLTPFDAVAIHYSVRLSIKEHLSKGIVQALARYGGPKLLFIQDEYDTTEVARCWIEKLGIDAVFTNVPLTSLEEVYPRSRFPHVDFIPTLTGYVPEDEAIDSFALPLEQRQCLIGYRGRKLPYQYGDLGYEKYRIGLDVRRLAEARGLPIDIEVDDAHRIYGNDWYRFLGSCRATLGTESGANVFDFDGTLTRLAAQHSDLPYEEFRAQFLTEHEGKVRMNQVSPKIFEAIRLRTALVLFEGEYSGVVRPDQHFIPLKKDYSNIDEVFSKLQDLSYLQKLTSRAYADVVESKRYSYQAFVGGIDEYLDGRFEGRVRGRLVSVPVVAVLGSAEQYDNLVAEHRAQFLISDDFLSRRNGREDYVSALGPLLSPRKSSDMNPGTASVTIIAADMEPSFTNVARLIARRLWRLMPAPVRDSLGEDLRPFLKSSLLHEAGTSKVTWLKLMPTLLRGMSRRFGKQRSGRS